MSMTFREEKDSMGSVRVPGDAYFGAQTQRAAENFPISGMTFPPVFLKTLSLVKQCAAQVNQELGLLPNETADAIMDACREVIEGRLDDQFVVDIFQTGSGTSTNMNMNEVIATRANERLTGQKNGKSPVHPNDHVNMGQSSNDVIPSVIHISALRVIDAQLLPALASLQKALQAKAQEFAEVQKIARTHLQDAVPIFLGQEFSGYARQVALGRERIGSVLPRLSELALGGTAVGNGLNTHADFAARTIGLLSQKTGLDLREAQDHFEAQSARDAVVEASGALKTIAVGLVKIANDIRWLSSGPRSGLGEIRIPSLQPGSSIMPGKVNPVIPEAVLQVAAQVIGNDTAITFGGQAGNFELNVMMPVMAHNFLTSIRLLAAAAQVFATKCINGIGADREACAAGIEKSLALTTGLVPYIGYDRAAALAHKAHQSGQTVRQVALADNILSPEQLDRCLGKEPKK